MRTESIPGILPRRQLPPVSRQHAAAAIIVVRPVAKSGAHAGEEEALVETSVVKVVVMEAGEEREESADQCRPAEARDPSHHRTHD